MTQSLWPTLDDFHIVNWCTTPLGDKRGSITINEVNRHYANGACCYFLELPGKFLIREKLAPPFQVERTTLSLYDFQLDMMVSHLKKIQCTPARFSGKEGDDGAHTFFVTVRMAKYGVAPDQRFGDLPKESMRLFHFSDDEQKESGDPNPMVQCFRLPRDMSHDVFQELLADLFREFEPRAAKVEHESVEDDNEADDETADVEANGNSDELVNEDADETQ